MKGYIFGSWFASSLPAVVRRVPVAGSSVHVDFQDSGETKNRFIPVPEGIKKTFIGGIYHAAGDGECVSPHSFVPILAFRGNQFFPGYQNQFHM